MSRYLELFLRLQEFPLSVDPLIVLLLQLLLHCHSGLFQRCELRLIVHLDLLKSLLGILQITALALVVVLEALDVLLVHRLLSLLVLDGLS